MIAAFRLTPSASSDLREISPVTLNMWGKERQRSYLAALDRRFRWLAEEPLRGRTSVPATTPALKERI